MFRKAAILSAFVAAVVGGVTAYLLSRKEKEEDVVDGEKTAEKEETAETPAEQEEAEDILEEVEAEENVAEGFAEPEQAAEEPAKEEPAKEEAPAAAKDKAVEEEKVAPTVEDVPNANPVTAPAQEVVKDENGKIDAATIASASDFSNWEETGCQG